MDWLNVWDPAPYVDERVEPPADAGQFVAWLVIAAIVLTAMVVWYRQRVVRHSFWCAAVGREVEVRQRLGCVISVLGIRESDRDCVRPALPRSHVPRAVAAGAARGDGATRRPAGR